MEGNVLRTAMKNAEHEERTRAFETLLKKQVEEPVFDMDDKIAEKHLSATIIKLEEKKQLLEAELAQAEEQRRMLNETITTRQNQIDATKAHLFTLKNALREVEDNPCP